MQRAFFLKNRFQYVEPSEFASPSDLKLLLPNKGVDITLKKPLESRSTGLCTSNKKE